MRSLLDLVRDGLGGRATPYRKRSLIALSHAMEDRGVHGDGPPPLVVGGFHCARFFEHDSDRSAAIARRSAMSVVAAGTRPCSWRATVRPRSGRAHPRPAQRCGLVVRPPPHPRGRPLGWGPPRHPRHLARPALEHRPRRPASHAAIGAAIVARVPALMASLPVVRHHHERWDGAGYPDGLAGERIPLGARVVAVVDAYDAMTTDRPYRRGMDPEEALQRVVAARGTQFCPVCVDAFRTVLMLEPLERSVAEPVTA